LQSYSTYPNQRFLIILTLIAISHPRSKYKPEPRENLRILRVLLLEISLRFLRSFHRNSIALACSTPLLSQTRYRKILSRGTLCCWRRRSMSLTPSVNTDERQKPDHIRNILRLNAQLLSPFH